MKFDHTTHLISRSSSRSDSPAKDWMNKPPMLDKESLEKMENA